MRAVDTNILVRLIARDNAEQAAVAETIIAGGTILILPTVLLECEWVLRSRYRLSRALIARSLETLLGQPGVVVVSLAAIAATLTRYARAGDFADHLHLALAEEANASTFVTFDQDLSGWSNSAIAVETA